MSNKRNEKLKLNVWRRNEISAKRNRMQWPESVISVSAGPSASYSAKEWRLINSKSGWRQCWRGWLIVIVSAAGGGVSGISSWRS
jgi:hypothetical protein